MDMEYNEIELSDFLKLNYFFPLIHSSQFNCSNHHRVIPCNLTCNSINDCGDDSDEKNCPGAASGWQGYLGAALASLFFGTNFIPVKTFDTGDGFFFQWVLCAAIWTVGLMVQFYVGETKFIPLAALGGASWATGNITVVPIITSIGLAQGMLIWGALNMISGWAAARFGFFGIIPEKPKHELLQYMGVMCGALSVLAFAAVKPSTAEQPEEKPTERTALLSDYPINAEPAVKSDAIDTMGWLKKWSTTSRRIFGVTLSIIGGILYSFAFDPAQYTMDRVRGASQDSLHYAFSQYCGIFITSTVWFLLYCIACRNRPNINPRIVLPAFISGLMWAVAQTSWFVANQHLSQAVAYPIISTCPGVIATLCGVLIFREIRGVRNFIAMAIAFAITFAGVALTALSNH